MQSDGSDGWLPVLDLLRGRDSWCWPKGARSLGMRMLDGEFKGATWRSAHLEKFCLNFSSSSFVKSVSNFSILHHPCSFMVCYYLVGDFLSHLTIISGFFNRPWAFEWDTWQFLQAADGLRILSSPFCCWCRCLLVSPVLAFAATLLACQ